MPFRMGGGWAIHERSGNQKARGEKRSMGEPENAFDFIDQLEASGEPVTRFGEITKFLGDKAKEKGTPLHGQFELTPFCNFSCKMCYVHLTPDQLAGQFPLSVSAWKDLM